jgi:hypothetical protein
MTVKGYNRGDIGSERWDGIEDRRGKERFDQTRERLKEVRACEKAKKTKDGDGSSPKFLEKREFR